VVSICTTRFKIHNSMFCPHSVFMCFVWISEQIAIISLYSIKWLVFVMETRCVFVSYEPPKDQQLTRYVLLFSSTHDTTLLSSSRSLSIPKRRQGPVTNAHFSQCSITVYECDLTSRHSTMKTKTEYASETFSIHLPNYTATPQKFVISISQKFLHVYLRITFFAG
jgi:hypothetical protein